MIELILLLFPFVLFYFIGNYIESRHYESIEKREQKTISLPIVSLKTLDPGTRVKSSRLVMGSAVISIDYFKRFIAGIKNFIGGRLGSYETLLDRARREALLRMKKSAGSCDIIMNIKYETSAIGKTVNDGKKVGCVEVLAYGTAVTYEKD